MKAIDIVAQLQAELPKYDNRFNTTVGISSLVAVGNVVTATTSTAHGLSNGDATTITGAKVETPISSLTLLNGIVTATTSADHDLTLETGATATVEGATEADYNGTFNLVSVKNRREFQYAISTTPSSPATGTLLEDRIDGYNGRFTITVTGITTFTYTVTFAPTGVAKVTNAFVNTLPRIARVINFEHAQNAYTAQNDQAFWAMVSLQDVTVSRDRNLLSDQTINLMKNQERRIDTIRRVNVDVFFPTSNEYSGGKARDEAEDVAVALVASLVGWQVPSDYSDDSGYLLGLNGHLAAEFNKAYYAHRYVFETREDITAPDTFQEDDRAFRDVALLINNDFDKVIASATVDLDEEPL